MFENFVRSCFRGKSDWGGATREHTRQRALRAATTEHRSQTAFCPKTLRAAELLPTAGVGSAVTARCGALRAAKAAWAAAKTSRRRTSRSF